MSRSTFLPFSRPSLGEEEIREVTEVLRSGWITTGPRTAAFEKAFAARLGVPYALGVNSATAGLHLSLVALGVGPGDEVVTTPMTFAATVNAILFTGATPVLADIDPATLNLDPGAAERACTPRTKAIVPVHFAGLPVDLDAFRDLAKRTGAALVEDCAHALGASYKGEPVGQNPAPLGVFSFHPTKNITTGEGGMVVTGDEDLGERVSVLRQHGMSKGAWNRYAEAGTPQYEVIMLGFKDNMLDLQAAIGLHQLDKLDRFQGRREEIAVRYDEAFRGQRGILPLGSPSYEHVHGRHLYCPLVDVDALGFDRDTFMARLKERNIGTALHYKAVHLHRYYRERFGWAREDFPQAARVSDRLVSLPLFPDMTDRDVEDVVEAVREVCAAPEAR